MKKILASLFLATTLLVLAVVPVGAATPIAFYSYSNTGNIVKFNAFGNDPVYGQEENEDGSLYWAKQGAMVICVGTYPDQNANFPANFTIKITAPNWPLENGSVALPLQYITPTVKTFTVPRAGSGEEWRYAKVGFTFKFPNNQSLIDKTYQFGITIYPTNHPESMQQYDGSVTLVKSLPIGA